MVGWHHQIDGHMDMNKLHEIVKDNEPGVLQSMGMKSDLMTDQQVYSIYINSDIDTTHKHISHIFIQS